VRLRRAFLTSVVGVALGAILAATPAYADDKPDSSGNRTGQSRIAPDEAVAKTALAVSPAVAQVSATIQSRIVDFVQIHGTEYTWGSYANPLTGKVVVETNAPADVTSSLVGAFGGMVELRKTTISDNFSRRSDTSPFWGGAGVTMTPGVFWCSTGYAVQNGSGVRSMVTAGHCFSNGTNVFTENGGIAMGSVSGNGLPSQDMELIGGQSYAGRHYTGGVDSTTSNAVVGAGDSFPGFADYCHSGRTTGENCGHTSISNDALVCTSSGCKSPVTSFNGGVSPQGGDSGSPFYVKSGTDSWIRGHVIAGDGVTSYAEKWSRVAARFGVTIVT
jgi:hypothetical protein